MRPGASTQAGDPAAEDWVAAKALAVLAGDSARAAEEITAEADAAGLAGNQRNGAAACVRYLENKREFLRYDQALQAGWPIATGVIEGACRHLIADRLSVGGARWGLEGAEAVLTLRAVISNGDFEEYWRFHLACEHQRLYPGTEPGTIHARRLTGQLTPNELDAKVLSAWLDALRASAAAEFGQRSVPDDILLSFLEVAAEDPADPRVQGWIRRRQRAGPCLTPSARSRQVRWSRRWAAGRWTG